MGLYVFTSKQSDVGHIILYQMHLAEKGPMIVGRRDIYQDQLIDYKPRVVSLALCQKNCQEFTDTIQGKTRTNTSLGLKVPSQLV